MRLLTPNTEYWSSLEGDVIATVDDVDYFLELNECRGLYRVRVKF